MILRASVRLRPAVCLSGLGHRGRLVCTRSFASRRFDYIPAGARLSDALLIFFFYTLHVTLALIIDEIFLKK
ncbi:hypothetical protein M408DRAFT_258607 [Serendipita vermifera MAFF 305830]|uniref:Uncharacterized protein n=1 Tax=Serendipita vermifera MAFF 305830 TaxID=933852 RepID=A0A0C3B3I0_SERVB|nr:hypothetical protein M408DRAFT_258607 [Serendipita vermifera MAFF 305830]